MQGTTTLLTLHELAYTLDVHPYTLDAMVHNGLIPHTYVQQPDSAATQLRFNPYSILDWLQTMPRIESMGETGYLDGLREQYKAFAPAVQALKELNGQFAPKREAKGYSLSKVPSKKFGFLYYVRYIEKGKLVPSRWNTHTNNEAAAHLFARESRERLLREYCAKKRPQNTDRKLYAILSGYYAANSPYFEEAKKRGRKITAKKQKVFCSWMQKTFVPFLRENNVADFQDITPPLIAKLQTHLLTKGNEPQTINQYIGSAIAVFDHMVMNGIISENVFDKVTRLKTHGSEPRGCYEIGTIAGAFNHKWREEREYFLSLIIYTTDMRNSEIERIRPKDIIELKGCHFIDIPKSKSISGVRIVPLHPFVREKLAAYIKKRNIPDDGYLFTRSGKALPAYAYRSANLALGKRLRKKLGIELCDVKKYLREQRITFYSGRYFWKTLMNANDLGDVEEYFMGHRVTSDVSKRYNRKDRVGQDMLVKKAREVFKILDKWVFKG